MAFIDICKGCGLQVGLLDFNGLCGKCKSEARNATHSVGVNAPSALTRLLMSAANLYPDDFEYDLKERLTHPYKSLAPEYGVDLNKIYQEVKNAKIALLRKSILLFAIMFSAILIFIQSPEDNWMVLLVALAFTTIFEFLYLKSQKNKVRDILAGKDKGKNSLEQVAPSYGNVTISGGYSPFIGSGIDLDSWSFTVNTKEAEDKQKPVLPFSVSELYEKITVSLKSLGFDDITIADGLYVNGRDVNLSAHLLPKGRLSKPVKNISTEYLIDKFNSNDKRERHYRVARVSMWDGQLILSMYYRFLTIEDNLFSEVRFFLLPPLHGKYLAINNITLTPTPVELRVDFFNSIFKGTVSWLAVVFKFLVFIQGGFYADKAKAKQWKKEVEDNQLYNYGWQSSLREKWSSFSYERYFQKVDKDFSYKLLTGEFLASLQSFLKAKNISIEKFSQTTTKIVNEGVIISGGEVRAESFAVGKGAKIANKVKSAVQ